MLLAMSLHSVYTYLWDSFLAKELCENHKKKLQKQKSFTINISHSEFRWDCTFENKHYSLQA